MPAIETPVVTLSNGKTIPILGLGTWKSQPGQVYEAVKSSIVEAGYRHIDCAFAYGNEAEVGKALAEVIASGIVKREDLFITSKLWNTFHSRENVPKCLEKSLSDLGLDYLDLYLIHWPFGYQEGSDEPIPRDADGNVILSDLDYLDTWKGIEDVYATGKVRSVGFSNFNSEQITRILENSTVKPVMNQVECHPYLNQSRLIEFCRERGIQVTAYSPLGSPDRAWAKPEDPSLLDDPKLVEIAAKHGKSTAQVLLRWQTQRGIVAIPKSVTPSRIASNISLFDFKLSKEEIDTIETFNRDYRFVALAHVAHHKHFPFGIPF
jgi:aldehyde reductase